MPTQFDCPVEMQEFCVCFQAFELATGDFLFNPSSRHNYPRDVDHLALFIETLGPVPKNIALAGSRSKQFFNKKGSKMYHKIERDLWPNVLVCAQHVRRSGNDKQLAVAIL